MLMVITRASHNAMCFDSLGVERIPKKSLKKITGNKNIVTNIYRIQAHHSIKCG